MDLLAIDHSNYDDCKHADKSDSLVLLYIRARQHLQTLCRRWWCERMSAGFCQSLLPRAIQHAHSQVSSELEYCSRSHCLPWLGTKMRTAVPLVSKANAFERRHFGSCQQTSLHRMKRGLRTCNVRPTVVRFNPLTSTDLAAYWRGLSY